MWRTDALIFEASTVIALLVTNFQTLSVEHLKAIRAYTASVFAACPMLTRDYATLEVFDDISLKTFVRLRVLLEVRMTLARIWTDTVAVNARWLTHRLAGSIRRLLIAQMTFAVLGRDTFAVSAALGTNRLALKVGNFSMAGITFALICRHTFRVYAIEVISRE